jgi:electron transport complex protein RnfD
MAKNEEVVSPFIHSGRDSKRVMAPLLIALTLLAALFSVRYNSQFFMRYILAIGFGVTLELVYTSLRDLKLSPPTSSTAVTTALLLLSIPAHMSSLQVGSGIFVAVIFGKLMVAKDSLRLNPMILGRLFLMLMYPDAMQEWQNPDIEIDALSAATPLGLFLSEGFAYGTPQLLLGNVTGLWEGFIAIIPGSPGDVMPILTIVMGVVLYFMGVLDWRASLTFIIAFGIATQVLGAPLLFSTFAGSIIFTAAFIITDPRTTPGSKSGRLIAGFLAGIINGVIRNFGYYPEGVVFAILIVNLLSPTLDSIAFRLRGWQLRFK